MANSDTRHEKRYGITAQVTFWWPASDGSIRSGNGTTRDISNRGVLVTAAKCPPPGSLVQMTVILPRSQANGNGMTLHGEGVVLRVQDSDHRPLAGESDTRFAASVQFYPELRSAANDSAESLSGAAETPVVN